MKIMPFLLVSQFNVFTEKHTIIFLQHQKKLKRELFPIFALCFESCDCENYNLIVVFVCVWNCKFVCLSLLFAFFLYQTFYLLQFSSKNFYVLNQKMLGWKYCDDHDINFLSLFDNFILQKTSYFIAKNCPYHWFFYRLMIVWLITKFE